MKERVRASIIGCVGLPARYGGFETLAANLVAYLDHHMLPWDLTVYCSSTAYAERLTYYGGARLRYVPLNANGASSILYDAWSVLEAAWRRDHVILVLGVSGALVLPFVRLFSRARLIVNIDGLEWKRPKWSKAAARFLRFSEWIAVRSAHVVIADNRGIVDHVRRAYSRDAVEIPYGGDHAVALLPAAAAAHMNTAEISPYALMLCRIEPENHIHLILEAFDRPGKIGLLAVGNWASSDYGRNLRDRYSDHPRISIMNPVFDQNTLTALRAGATLYVHGHSAGGTNPALVEMMHFGTPVVAFDCSYNRHTTEDAAAYFSSAEELASLVTRFDPAEAASHGVKMREIACRRYTWDIVGRQYFAAMSVASPR